MWIIHTPLSRPRSGFYLIIYRSNCSEPEFVLSPRRIGNYINLLFFVVVCQWLLINHVGCSRIVNYRAGQIRWTEGILFFLFPTTWPIFFFNFSNILWHFVFYWQWTERRWRRDDIWQRAWPSLNVCHLLNQLNDCFWPVFVVYWKNDSVFCFHHHLLTRS